MIMYGFVIIACAWLAGPTRPATEVRRFLAPSLRDSPAIAYSVVGGVLFLLVLVAPTAAFRSVVWVLVFAVLFAYGVTMLRRQTAAEFPGIEHGHALRDFRDRRVAARAQRTARSAAPDTGAAIAEPRVGGAPVAPSEGRVDTLERLAALRDRGAITDEEYQTEKRLVMSSST
jgi:hypothetical protein